MTADHAIGFILATIFSALFLGVVFIWHLILGIWRLGPLMLGILAIVLVIAGAAWLATPHPTSSFPLPPA